MPKFPRVTPRKLIAALLRQGFFRDRQHGSHVMLLHADGRRAVIPLHARELPPGTLQGILRDIECSVDDCIAML